MKASATRQSEIEVIEKADVAWNRSCLSWGRTFRFDQVVIPLNWTGDDLPTGLGRSLLPYGLGRSYGDSCLNDKGVLLSTSLMNRFLAFDPNSGLFRCEAGTSFSEILEWAVPRGWFLPVTPGTRFVTVGGALANDVHGKNHHRAGTFGRHVTQFELLRSDGSRLICSPKQNSELYAATIGGLGLTGLVTWVEFSLKRFPSCGIESEEIQFHGVDEFLELSKDSDGGFEYTMAWVDCASRGRNLARGVFIRGNNYSGEFAPLSLGAPKISVPMEAPEFLLNSVTIKAFNALYFHKSLRKRRKRVVPFEGFFYPLDSIGNWSRIYGKRGFFQYQFVVPDENREVLKEIFAAIAESGRGSFLAVLKRFGSLTSPGLLSFPAPGLTLALDFPNQGTETLALFRRLDSLVLSAGGRFYPAKDSAMTAEAFQSTYPRWREFSRQVDPAFSSSFWRRVTA